MEKTGRITRIHPDEGTVEEVHHIPGVYQSFDNSGAHAMMLHPDFGATLPLRQLHLLGIPAAGQVDLQLVRGCGGGERNAAGRIAGEQLPQRQPPARRPDGYMYFCTGDMYMAMIARTWTTLGARCFDGLGRTQRRTTLLATASTATATATPRADVLGQRTLVLERTRSGERRRGEPNCGRGQLWMAAH